MTGDENKRNFMSVMAQLRANYVAGLASKADRLAEALVLSLAGEPGAAADVTQQIHRLAGTAGSFGVKEVSAGANHLELCLHNGASHADLEGDIVAFIQLLRDCSAAG